MICISIQEKHRGKATSLANTAQMAEIRIDLAGYKEKDVEFIFSKADCILIATCRVDNMDVEMQKKLLSTAIENGADYVDIDIDDDKSLKKDIIALAIEHNCKVIISYHNYEETPSKDELLKVIDTCFNEGADIAKIATTANSSQDSARVLGLYEIDKPLVALAMGEHGKITRVANLGLGSPFSFAAVSEETKTAPGQLTVEEMIPYLHILD